MKLSVGYGFQKNLIEQLAFFPEVKEIYGKMLKDPIGGGRSSLTFQNVSRKKLIESINTAKKHNIKFNYLINGSTLNGIEQTKNGQKKIRKLLDFLYENKVDGVTISVPYLIRVVKKYYQDLYVRVGAFAVVDSPEKSRQWEDMGADTICLSALSCNRDFNKLEKIKKSVDCELQLIVNSSCIYNCSYELTHMNMLTNSSGKYDRNKGFCFDYCLLNCSGKKLKEPVNLIKTTWIRPEDLKMYEDLGYTYFKILERSSPADLIVKRVTAYTERSFTGNLMELAAPVALIKTEQKPDIFQRIKMILTMLKPHKVKIATLLNYKKYMENMIIHDFSKANSPIYIDNKSLDGFLSEYLKIDCAGNMDCKKCKYCEMTAEKYVKMNQDYKTSQLKLLKQIDDEFI